MNKYVVKVSSIFSNIIEVDANNEEEARKNAEEFLKNREAKDQAMRHYYESTFPPEHWPVITQEKYDQLKEEVKSQVELQKSESTDPK